ncbi:MAG: ABC transporter ATP-binding protein [Thioclava marina]|uniref:ABC transporter ATP-binding protein n=1 Tax=Thioclava TaxID=285107 RepID=UPI0009974C61|nr:MULTISPECIES: ATP-binding cassette domain-containing protein [Thioclava]TNE89921.1 MAG: ABC transporter ATP-binding protein [Paracoccaceae bacterium]MBC7143843.1 ABC transporter ATP-binding protein [Thioclava marina]MBD3805181.1 ABC transporter ATP-binding protein [Thioclava sp.]OOY28670.1 ABC transporter ATP-binding protein [Thioclava sp. L04-15]TNF13724.1 MAG: ABC transporter ATP-binding protein [Paracoccaceae bacterium]
MIRLDLQKKGYGGVPVLGPMQLHVGRGEVLGLSGASGAGKTTLLRILAGLDTRFEGTLEVRGRRAMVFQNPTLMPWRRVIDNVTLPTSATEAQARAILARVGLEGVEDHWPGQISVGQARRVGLARAFVTKPDLLLMDEPFASLDGARVEDLLELTAALIAETNAAVVIASHSTAELDALATRFARVDGRPARLLQDDRVRAGS